jgi:hypothetical protein
MTEAIRPTYEGIQQEARGPGVDEWKRADKLRADLSSTYQSLRDDPRYTEEHKAETAWAKYEETRAQVEKLAPEAREKMIRSAEGLERLSIPTPEGEGLITKDTSKLLLTAHERSRIEGLLSRAKEVGGQSGFAQKPHAILSREYERGLNEGGPAGGATVRAVYGLARDWGLDIHTIADKHRKAHHHSALEDAQAALMRAEMVGRSVPEPPFKRVRGGTTPRGNVGTLSGAPKAFVPKAVHGQQLFKKRNRHW